MRVLMIVMSDVLRDARVRREALSLASAGYNVTIIGDRPPNKDAEPVAGAEVRFARGLRGTQGSRARTSCILRWLLLPWHRRRNERAFQVRAKELAQSLPKADVVHAHDFTALPPAVAIAHSSNAPLVYDAHECWLGRKLEGRPVPLQRLRDRSREAKLGSEAAVVLTVSAGIAEWLHQNHGWPQIEVIHNSFPPRPYVAPLRPTGLLYAGRIDAKRDLATVARAIDRLPQMRITAIGPDDGSPGAWKERLDIRPAIPADELDELYRAHGLGLISLEAGSINHELALPNKLFQAIRAGVPVVAADLPELRRLITHHGIGTLYRPGSVSGFVRAVEEAVDRFDDLVENVANARHTLSWARDEDRLLALYAELAKGT